MIVNPTVCTKLDVWSPRYKDKHGELAEPVVLLARYKVEQAAPTVLVDFSKAKHLNGQRFAIKRSEAMTFPLASNTKIDCYAVPLSKFERWETRIEILEIVDEVFPK